MNNEQYKDLMQRYAYAAGEVKIVCGVSNNAAYLVMMDAIDKIKQHPAYKKHNVKYEYQRALKQYDRYEKDLLYASENRFFAVKDMTPETRKRYGNITDREYFEFWRESGNYAYTKTRPMITSLWNKYRLSLIGHDIPHADLLAWAMVTMATLELAVKVQETSVEQSAKIYRLRESECRRIFKPFSLTPVKTLWNKAMVMTEPKAHDYSLNHTEERNIAYGIEQLYEAWTSPDMIFHSVQKNVEDYGEVFRTKGEQKKMAQTFANVRNAI